MVEVATTESFKDARTLPPVNALPGEGRQNLPPSEGMQFFGHVKIDGASGQMTVTLRDRADTALWAITLDPKTG